MKTFTFLYLICIFFLVTALGNKLPSIMRVLALSVSSPIRKTEIEFGANFVPGSANYEPAEMVNFTENTKI